MNRAERRRRTARKIRQRVRQARDLFDDAAEIGPPGRWRNRSPLDCGNAKCGLCHGNKVTGVGKAERIERQAARQRDLE